MTKIHVESRGGQSSLFSNVTQASGCFFGILYRRIIQQLPVLPYGPPHQALSNVAMCSPDTSGSTPPQCNCAVRLKVPREGRSGPGSKLAGTAQTRQREICRTCGNQQHGTTDEACGDILNRYATPRLYRVVRAQWPHASENP